MRHANFEYIRSILKRFAAEPTFKPSSLTAIAYPRRTRSNALSPANVWQIRRVVLFEFYRDAASVLIDLESPSRASQCNEFVAALQHAGYEVASASDENVMLRRALRGGTEIDSELRLLKRLEDLEGPVGERARKDRAGVGRAPMTFPRALHKIEAANIAWDDVSTTIVRSQGFRWRGQKGTLTIGVIGTASAAEGRSLEVYVRLTSKEGTLGKELRRHVERELRAAGYTTRSKDAEWKSVRGASSALRECRAIERRIIETIHTQ